MKDKLQLLLNKEGLSANKFANILDTQPARISHILSGRNKPSCDLIQKILQQFPHINPDWLLLDSEYMYRDSIDEPTNQGASDAAKDKDLFSAAIDNGPASRESIVSENPDFPGFCSPSKSDTKIERIIILYTDGTFRDFRKD